MLIRGSPFNDEWVTYPKFTNRLGAPVGGVVAFGRGRVANFSGLGASGWVNLTYDQAFTYVNAWPDLKAAFYDPNVDHYGLNDIQSWGTAHYNNYGMAEGRSLTGPAQAPSAPAPAPVYSPAPAPSPTYSPAPAPAPAYSGPSYSQLVQIAGQLWAAGYSSGDAYNSLVNAWGAPPELARSVMQGYNWNDPNRGHAAAPSPSPAPAPAAGDHYTDDEIAFAWIDFLSTPGATSANFRTQLMAGGSVSLEQLNRVGRRPDVVAADEAARARNAQGTGGGGIQAPAPAPLPGAGTGGPGAPAVAPAPAPAAGGLGNLSTNSMLLLAVGALALVTIAK